MIEFVRVLIGSTEPVACRRCAGSASRTPDARPLELVDADLASTAREWTRGPGPNVWFEGLEPFVHPQLPQVIGSAAAKGFERIRLTTDGGALSQGGNAGGVVRTGVTHIDIVLLGDRASHDRLTGFDGLFDAATAGAAAFLAAGRAEGRRLTLSGRVVLCRHNVDSAPAAVAALASCGATAVAIDASGLEASAAGKLAIEACLQTATVNRAAAFVTGWSAARGIDSVAPWRVSEVTT